MKPNTAKHTPGPWEVARHGTTPGNTSIEVQTETGLPVAVMSYCGRAEENAELIASAPALLAERDALRSERDKLKAAIRVVVAILDETAGPGRDAGRAALYWDDPEADALRNALK